MYIIAAIIIGIILNAIILKYIQNKATSISEKLVVCDAARVRLENELKEIRNTSTRIIDEQKKNITEIQSELNQAREKLSSFETGLKYEKEQNQSSQNKIATLETDLKARQKQEISLETERNVLKEQHETNLKQMQAMQSLMKGEFENIANKIFTETSKNFKQESQEKLGELIGPLKTNIQEFKTTIESAFKEQTSQQYSLKNEIQKIVTVNENMSTQTVNLTKALKGDFRTQGTWGEVVLEKILEDSGLRPDEDYVLQGSKMGLKCPDDNQRLKPDVIIKLPDNKHVIVDSKVSLIDYQRFHEELDEDKKKQYLKQFLNSIKNHISDLKSKGYQNVDKLAAPDFVLMFMPIESAYSLAIKYDQGISNYAWTNRIIIVCPTTLFATLRTIASIWKIDLQEKHSLKIADQGRRIYEKVCGFVDDMVRLGKQIKTSQDTYDDAMNKLSTGRGNIIARTQQLDKLGVKTSKRLLKLIPEAFEEEELEEIQGTEDLAVISNQEGKQKAIVEEMNGDDKSDAKNNTWDEVPF